MSILHPVISMIILTLLVAIRLGYFAISSVFRGKVHIKQLRVYEGEFPTNYKSARQHYKNMFEMPILFYLLCTLFLINNNYTQLDLVLAWGFVIFRVLHSIVRIQNRDVNLRFGAFTGSFIMLVCGWVNFSLKYL